MMAGSVSPFTNITGQFCGGTQTSGFSPPLAPPDDAWVGPTPYWLAPEARLE